MLSCTIPVAALVGIFTRFGRSTFQRNGSRTDLVVAECTFGVYENSRPLHFQGDSLPIHHCLSGIDLCRIPCLLAWIVRQSATVRDVWAISAAYIPNVLTFTIPMAVLVGILTGFGRMSSDSEAIAFRATGVSMIR